jgi:uncharacterized protein (DUF58 family)
VSDAARRPTSGGPGEASAPASGGPRSGWFLPTRRLALLVALFAPLWLLSASEGGAAAALLALLTLLVLAAADSAALPAARDLGVERQLPETVGLGDPVEGTYQVRGAGGYWPRGVRFALVHDFPDAVADESPPRAPFPLAPDETAALPLLVRAGRRGRHPLGPAVLRAVGPLGLVQRSLRYPLADAVTVAPSVAQVRRYRLLALQHRLRDAGIRVVRRRGGGTTFDSLREYAVGDDPRHVDWKATARRAAPVVRLYRAEQGQTVMVAVDAGRLMTQLAGPVSRFEHALTAALVLADVAAASGDQVGCLVFDDAPRVFVPPAGGRRHLADLRQALVDVRPTMAEPDYAAAFRALAQRHRRRSLLVLFSDVIDPRASQALIALTARSAARHLPVVVALRNDELAAAAVPSPDATSRALYASAAAEELMLAREEGLQRMRRAGVSVLDASPQELSAAIVNRYLEIKARASL